MTDLSSITRKLDQKYKEWKSGEKGKNTAKGEFFKAVDELLKDEGLAEYYMIVDAPSEEEARTRLEREYPGRLVDDIRPISPGSSSYEVIMIDAVPVTPYTYVNRDLGMVFKRVVEQGPVMVDDERLQHENPDLWKRITDVPFEAWIKEVIYHCGAAHPQEINEIFEGFLSFPGAPERTLKDVGTLTDEDRAALSEYVYYGKPTVKLAPPRKAQAEELE